MAGYASHLITQYAREVGMGGLPDDAMQQYQLTLLQQWMDHLEVVLRDEQMPFEQAQRIMRTFLYGAMPQKVDAQLRVQMSAAHRRDLERLAAQPLIDAGFPIDLPPV